MHSVRAILVLFAALASAAPPANAQGAIALWLEAQGEVRPSVAPMTELAARAEFTLAPQARLRFFHFGTCTAVAVEGGSLEIGEAGYRTSAGGKVVAVEKRRCPARVSLAAAGAGGQTASGLVLRGEEKDVTYPPEPGFVLAGRGALRIAKAEVIGEGGGAATRVVLTLDGNRAVWPKGEAPLAPGGTYALRLLDAGGIELVRFAFKVGAEAATQEFDLIYVD